MRTVLCSRKSAASLGLLSSWAYSPQPTLESFSAGTSHTDVTAGREGGEAAVACVASRRAQSAGKGRATGGPGLCPTPREHKSAGEHVTEERARTCWGMQKGVRETRCGGGRCSACGCARHAVPPRSRSRHRLPPPPARRPHTREETAVRNPPQSTTNPPPRPVPLRGNAARQPHAERTLNERLATGDHKDTEARLSDE